MNKEFMIWACLNVSKNVSFLPQGQGFWVHHTWVWCRPSWRRLPLTPPQSHQNLPRTGETDSWRMQTKPCLHQNPGEKSSFSTTDWPRLACECPGVSGGSMGRWWPAEVSEALSVAMHAWNLRKDLIFITYIVWPQVKQQGGNSTLSTKRKLV